MSSSVYSEDGVRLAAEDAKQYLEKSKFFSDLTEKFEKFNTVLHELVDTDGTSSDNIQ